MDVTDIAPLLDKLDGDLAGLQAALKPLLSDLEGVSSKLPLLDRAKLQVLVAYAIESLLFSTLHLNGVEARNHAIFTELARVKQYFEKIKKAETPVAPRETTVNTEAAIRFIKNDLNDNKEVVDRLKEQLEREKRAKEQVKMALEAAKAKKRDTEALDDPTRQGEAEGEGSSRKRTKHKSSKASKR